MTSLCNLGRTLLSGLAAASVLGCQGFFQGWLRPAGLKVPKLCNTPRNHPAFIFPFLYVVSHHGRVSAVEQRSQWGEGGVSEAQVSLSGCVFLDCSFQHKYFPAWDQISCLIT